MEEAGGDMEKALVILRKESARAASKKADRTLAAGAVQSYVHTNNQVGVIVELSCETDFVAKNSEFLALASSIALHIAAMSPAFIKKEDITEGDRVKVREVMEKEVADMNKPEDIKAKILEGKMNDYFAEKTLLDQAFVRTPDITVGKLIEEAIQKIGEKIEVRRFVRYATSE